MPVLIFNSSRVLPAITMMFFAEPFFIASIGKIRHNVAVNHRHEGRQSAFGFTHDYPQFLLRIKQLLC